MPSKRLQQINELIKEELGAAFIKEVEFPLGCLVTITKVETAADLKHALVWLSVIPTTWQKEVIYLLSKNKLNFQHILREHLRTKNTPKIQFRIDESAEKAERITSLLDTLK